MEHPQISDDRSEIKGRKGWHTALQRVDWKLITMMLAIKVLVLVFAVESYGVMTDQPVAGWRGWLEIWNHWDTLHYLKLAQFGYGTSEDMKMSLIFYPLFP